MDSDHESEDDFNNNDDARSDDGSERGDAEDGKVFACNVLPSPPLLESILFLSGSMGLSKLTCVGGSFPPSLSIRYDRECHTSRTTTRPNNRRGCFIVNIRRRVFDQVTQTIGLATQYLRLPDL